MTSFSRLFLPLKNILLHEALQIEGFMQLLMKKRNGIPWTPEERKALLQHLNAMAKAVPALLIFSLPGGMILLPILAWVLDRRRNRARTSTSAADSTKSQQTEIRE